MARLDHQIRTRSQQPHLVGRPKFFARGVAMTSQYVPAQVTIRRYPDSPICDVVVVVRDREMVLHFRDYCRAVQWARIECKSYKIPEPHLPNNQETHDVPLFLRSNRE
jgi:hypothetical protein